MYYVYIVCSTRVPVVDCFQLIIILYRYIYFFLTITYVYCRPRCKRTPDTRTHGFHKSNRDFPTLTYFVFINQYNNCTFFRYTQCPINLGNVKNDNFKNTIFTTIRKGNSRAKYAVQPGIILRAMQIELNYYLLKKKNGLCP